MEISIGDRVGWTSKSGGVVRVREGEVVMVIPALKRVTNRDFIDASKKYQTTRLKRQLTQSSGLRCARSFVIAVHDETNERQSLYWPHEYQVQLIQEVG